MGLTKTKLGHYIELCQVTNDNLVFGVEDVRGVNNLKLLMPTKADINGRDLSKFQIVYPGQFVFNHRTSRNGSKFSIAYNDGNKPIICTEDYVVFKIKESAKKSLVAEWLYMYFNRPEFDRYVITNSWGSSTEFYNWEDLCEIKIELPDFLVQQKYVNIYHCLNTNQQSYEHGLEDLKIVCDSYIENLRRSIPITKIGPYLTEINQRNDIGLNINAVRGLTTAKQIIPTKADMSGVSLTNYKVIQPGQIAYVPDTSRRGDKVSLGYNDTTESFLLSSISIVFETNHDFLLPDYLMLFLTRSEFDRYARFNSWGSARETFDWDEMCNIKIPIPDIKVQKSIAQIYRAYIMRKRINDQLKAQIKAICPVLIRGSLENGG